MEFRDNHYLLPNDKQQQQQQHYQQQQHLQYQQQQFLPPNQHPYIQQQQPHHQQHQQQQQNQNYGINSNFQFSSSMFQAPVSNSYQQQQQQQRVNQQFSFPISSSSSQQSLPISVSNGNNSSIGVLPPSVSSPIPNIPFRNSLPSSPVFNDGNITSNVGLDIGLAPFPIQNQVQGQTNFSGTIIPGGYSQNGINMNFANTGISSATSNDFGAGDMYIPSIPQFSFLNEGNSLGMGNLVVGGPISSSIPVTTITKNGKEQPKKVAKTTSLSSPSAKLSSSSSSSSNSLLLPPPPPSTKSKSKSKNSKISSTPIPKRRPSMTSEDTKSSGDSPGINSLNMSYTDGNNSDEHADPKLQKKLKKYDREKGIRRHENELFTELAQMCGLSPSGDKASILKALIKVVEEKKKRKMEQMNSSNTRDQPLSNHINHQQDMLNQFFVHDQSIDKISTQSGLFDLKSDNKIDDNMIKCDPYDESRNENSSNF